MHLVRLTITLKGHYENTTIELHNRLFKDGVYTTIATEAEATGLATFFGRSFNSTVTCTKVDPNTDQEEDVLTDVLEEVLPNAGAEDDVPDPDTGEFDPFEKLNFEPEDEYEVPTDREALILNAVQDIDQEEWVDDVVNHPSVAAIVEAVGDITITKDEIVAVIENWLVDEDEEDTTE